MIKTKADARNFLNLYQELSIPYESFMFRYDGKGEYKKEYTILHEENGYVGASEDEAASYVYRHRKYINAWLKDDGTIYVTGAFRKQKGE